MSVQLDNQTVLDLNQNLQTIWTEAMAIFDDLNATKKFDIALVTKINRLGAAFAAFQSVLQLRALMSLPPVLRRQVAAELIEREMR